MILPIVQFGHPILRTKGLPVTDINDDIRKLASDMIETMYHAEGVGLAAQQVGHALQICVLDASQSETRASTLKVNGEPVNLADWMPMTVINPQLELLPPKETDSEGCLSFPNITGNVIRPGLVRAKVTLLDGRNIDIEATGLLSRALQHEVDHLNGVLFIDRMSAASKAVLSGKLRRLQQKQKR